MKKLIEKVRECNLPLAAALGTWLIFLVLHTVVYRVNFEDHAGNLGYLLRAAAVLILLILFICSVISIKKILDYNWPWDMDDELLDELLSFDDEMGEAGSKAMGAAEDAVGSKTMDAAGSKAMSAAGVTAGSKTMGAAEVTAGSKAMGAAGDVAENREDYDIWDMEEDYETFEAGSGTLYKSLLVVFALSLLFLVMLVLEVCTTSFSLYVDRDYIFAGAIAVDKTYLYDVILIFAFPLWTQVIFKGMKEKNFHYTSVISACLQLTMLTVMQFLLYMEHSGIWMLELAAVDLLTLSAAVRKYTGESHGKRKNTVHFTVFYAALWFGLLLLLHNSGRGLLQYIADGSWRRYMENVFFLMRNAAISGPAYALQTNMRIYEFLFNNNDYLQSALYYWGWKAVLEILLALFVFLAATRKLLGKSM